MYWMGAECFIEHRGREVDATLLCKCAQPRLFGEIPSQGHGQGPRLAAQRQIILGRTNEKTHVYLNRGTRYSRQKNRRIEGSLSISGMRPAIFACALGVSVQCMPG